MVHRQQSRIAIILTARLETEAQHLNQAPRAEVRLHFFLDIYDELKWRPAEQWTLLFYVHPNARQRRFCPSRAVNTERYFVSIAFSLPRFNVRLLHFDRFISARHRVDIATWKRRGCNRMLRCKSASLRCVDNAPCVLNNSSIIDAVNVTFMAHQYSFIANCQAILRDAQWCHCYRR